MWSRCSTPSRWVVPLNSIRCHQRRPSYRPLKKPLGSAKAAASTDSVRGRVRNLEGEPSRLCTKRLMKVPWFGRTKKVRMHDSTVSSFPIRPVERAVEELAAAAAAAAASCSPSALGSVSRKDDRGLEDGSAFLGSTASVATKKSSSVCDGMLSPVEPEPEREVASDSCLGVEDLVMVRCQRARVLRTGLSFLVLECDEEGIKGVGEPSRLLQRESMRRSPVAPALFFLGLPLAMMAEPPPPPLLAPLAPLVLGEPPVPMTMVEPPLGTVEPPITILDPVAVGAVRTEEPRGGEVAVARTAAAATTAADLGDRGCS